MKSPFLHYVHDPLCGWCYAAAPMVEAAVSSGMGIVLHGGNLWKQPTNLTPEQRAYIRQHDTRIADLSGVAFGSAYLDTLLANDGTLFWSPPPIRGVIAAAHVRGGADLPMLQAIQRAHYVEGLAVVDRIVLSNVAEAIGLERGAFLAAFDAAPVDDHIRESGHLMDNLGLRGFPSFFVERGSDRLRVPHEPFYGRPEAFVRAVRDASEHLTILQGASA